MRFKDAKITERAHRILKLIARKGGYTLYGAVEVAAEHYARHKKILQKESFASDNQASPR